MAIGLDNGNACRAHAAIAEVLRAQPTASAEPVAWRWRWKDRPGMEWQISSIGPWYETENIEVQPLYAAPVAAQTAAELAECRSAVAEVLALLERSLAVIQHDIDELGGCDHSVGICCCELIHLADDIRAAMQRTTAAGSPLREGGE